MTARPRQWAWSAVEEAVGTLPPPTTNRGTRDYSDAWVESILRYDVGSLLADATGDEPEVRRITGCAHRGMGVGCDA